MSDLTFIEKRSFEQLFGMGSGYVLNFSNRTFEEFIIDSIGKNIYDSKYNSLSGSKANRLRAFWEIEANHLVGKLMSDMVYYAASLETFNDTNLVATCQQTASRLLQSAPVPEIDVIVPNAAGSTFESLAKSVRQAIDNNEPQTALDRLHTFVVKYIRTICQRHGISTEPEKPLHSIFGEYVKYLKHTGKLKSDMSERILKSCISILDAFNSVRNNQSFAHDNEILDHAEALLIFNNVTGTIRFIQAFEKPTGVLTLNPVYPFQGTLR